tara:strand:+ start:3738 stop:5312 length:1575 start_codon:yes stop_codon:yes gene_type:complete
VTELEKQRLLAAITRSNRGYTGAANPTLANVGQQTANTGMTAGSRSGYATALDARTERENAEAMARSFKGQESNIASQRARAAALRGKGMPQNRMINEGTPYATLVNPNWGETLQGVTGKLLGGYLEGQAIQDAEQLDVDQTEQAGLVLAKAEKERLAELALEAERYAQEQSNWKADYDQTGSLGQQKIDATNRAQNYTENAGTPEPYQSLTDASVIMAIKTPTGEIFEYNETGGRGDRLDASTWTPLQNPEATGSSSTVTDQMNMETVKQDGRMTLEEYRQTGRKDLAKLNAQLREDANISEEERKYLIGQRVILRELEREDREETGKSAIEAQEAITSGSAVLRRGNMYEATGGNPAALFSYLTGYDLTEGGDIGATQRMIAILGSQGAAKDFARLNLKPISDYEANYIINDLNISSKDQPKSILTYTMQYNDMYKQALADGEKDGAIALGAAEQVMNQRYDDQVILGSLRNNGNMTMGITEMEENGLPVREVYDRLRKKLKDGTIDTREKQALLSLSQAYQ